MSLTDSTGLSAGSGTAVGSTGTVETMPHNVAHCQALSVRGQGWHGLTHGGIGRTLALWK